MKAENKTTIHNRTIRLTELPIGQFCCKSEMLITINYVEDQNIQRLDLAVALDNVIIPAIIKAINQKDLIKEAISGLQTFGGAAVEDTLNKLKQILNSK